MYILPLSHFKYPDALLLVYYGIYFGIRLSSLEQTVFRYASKGLCQDSRVAIPLLLFALSLPAQESHKIPLTRNHIINIHLLDKTSM